MAKRSRGKHWDGSKLKELRKKANLTQGQLADATGIYATDVSDYERGIKAPSFDVLVEMAVALGADLNSFAPKVPPPKAE